jgi:uncharacterized integral membrane protein
MINGYKSFQQVKLIQQVLDHHYNQTEHHFTEREFEAVELGLKAYMKTSTTYMIVFITCAITTFISLGILMLNNFTDQQIEFFVKQPFGLEIALGIGLLLTLGVISYKRYNKAYDAVNKNRNTMTEEMAEEIKKAAQQYQIILICLISLVCFNFIVRTAAQVTITP